MNFDRFHVALIATLAYDVTVHARNRRRINHVVEENQRLVDQVNLQCIQIQHLINIINEHNVPVDEFDRILINL